MIFAQPYVKLIWVYMQQLCPKCQQDIEKMGLREALLFRRVYNESLAGGTCVMDTSWPSMYMHILALKNLEQAGYLLSTELSWCEVAILLNLTMAWWHPEQEAFCWRLEAHDDGMWN